MKEKIKKSVSQTRVVFNVEEGEDKNLPVPEEVYDD